MDLELPTSRGTLPPANKKDSAHEDNELNIESNIADLDDSDERPGGRLSYSYANSSIMWSEVRDNLAPLTWICIVVSLMIVIAVIIKVGFSPFIGHVLMMTLGWVGFSSEAMLVYRPFDVLNERTPNRRIQRNIHKIMHVGTAVCSIVGLIFILFHRVRLGKSVIPHNFHMWLGFLSIALLCIQAEAGRRKLVCLQFEGRRILLWHGIVGKITYACGIVSVILGLSHVFKDTPSLFLWSAIVLVLVLFVLYAYLRNNKAAGYSVVDQL
jgi:hypothetical protein